MRKKVLVISENIYDVKVICDELIHASYEVVMTQKNIQGNEVSDLQFLSYFDLVVLHEMQFAWLEQSFIDIFLSLNTKIIIISSPERQGELNAMNPEIICLSYPLSLELLLRSARLLLNQSPTNTQMEQSIVQPTSFVKENKPDQIHIDGHVLSFKGQQVILSKREQELLSLLVQANYQPLPTSVIYEQIWKQPFKVQNQPIISNLVRNLRYEVQTTFDTDQEFILNKKGSGYYLNKVIV